MTLLIVDDNAVVRRMIRRIIGDLVSDIRECTDGAEAVTVYGKLHPDVVLMDIEMSGVDGIGLPQRQSHYCDGAQRRAVACRSARCGRVRLRVERKPA